MANVVTLNPTPDIEVIPEDPEHVYTEIARRFFNEFLELKLRVEHYVSPDEQEKALAQYKKANRDLRTAAADLSKENDRLSGVIADQEAQITELRRQLNESLIKGRLGQRMARAASDHNVPFDQLMSEEVFRDWKRFMEEVPRGTHD